ncbi:hypothetical protein BDZ97DRAFT_1794744 [Flammula alnicola]|nr:hypothetical protein BDZ97DRAFT_1794744 [Flammula alnicola]
MAKSTEDTNQLRYYTYRTGSILQVDFYPEATPSGARNVDSGPQQPRKPTTVSLKVIRTLSRTFSSVLLVSLSSYARGTSSSRRKPKKRPLPSSSHMILKLCDRRFATGLREEYKALEWTPDIESDFLAFQALPEDRKPEVNIAIGFEGDSWYDEDDSGEEKEKLRHGMRDGSEEERGEKKKISNDKWSPGHREAYLEKRCDKLYEQEVEVYRALAGVQGDVVPLLYGTVHVRGRDRKGRTIVQAKGLLMEYKHSSFSLRDIPERIRNQDLWHNVGKAAVKLVQEVGDLGVLNRDVRLDNILVVPLETSSSDKVPSPDSSWELLPNPQELEPRNETKQFKLIMIDFGMARVQGEDETDEEFRKARRSQDEEGAVGYVLEQYLMKRRAELSHSKATEKPFKFKHSRRLDRPWDNDDVDI